MSANLDGLNAMISLWNGAIEKALDKTSEAVRRGAAARTKGELAKSIHVLRDTVGASFFREILADKPYAHWVENGRAAFEMRDKMLHFFINGEEFFRRSVGPAKAQPFMGPMRASAERWLASQLNTEISRLIVN